MSFQYSIILSKYSQKHSAQTHVEKKKKKKKKIKELGIEVNPSSGLNLGAWVMELENDQDKEFLLKGIENGFDIIDEDVHISPVDCKNHPSAKPNSPLYEKVSKQMLKEIHAGHYVILGVFFVTNPTDIVSPMAAITKPYGEVRLIHDCSRPSGKKGKRKVQGVPQLQTAALPRPQEEEETDK